MFTITKLQDATFRIDAVAAFARPADLPRLVRQYGTLRDFALANLAHVSDTRDGNFALLHAGDVVATAEYGCVTVTS